MAHNPIAYWSFRRGIVFQYGIENSLRFFTAFPAFR